MISYQSLITIMKCREPSLTMRLPSSSSLVTMRFTMRWNMTLSLWNSFRTMAVGQHPAPLGKKYIFFPNLNDQMVFWLWGCSPTPFLASWLWPIGPGRPINTNHFATDEPVELPNPSTPWLLWDLLQPRAISLNWGPEADRNDAQQWWFNGESWWLILVKKMG